MQNGLRCSSGVLNCRSETLRLVEAATVVAAVLSVGFHCGSFSHFSAAFAGARYMSCSSALRAAGDRQARLRAMPAPAACSLAARPVMNLRNENAAAFECSGLRSALFRAVQ